HTLSLHTLFRTRQVTFTDGTITDGYYLVEFVYTAGHAHVQFVPHDANFLCLHSDIGKYKNAVCLGLNTIAAFVIRTCLASCPLHADRNARNRSAMHQIAYPTTNLHVLSLQPGRQ